MSWKVSCRQSDFAGPFAHIKMDEDRIAEQLTNEAIRGFGEG